MATKASTRDLDPRGRALSTRHTWSGLANGDDGAPAEFPLMSDRTVQVFGTFGAGGSVTIEGSLDGVNFSTLTDPQGNQLTLGSAKVESIMEVVQYIRPRVTAGDGATNLTVMILMVGAV